MALESPSLRTAPPDEASTREQLLDVALHAFAELGYDGASTRVIAARAGVNQGLIPYYFGSKEALWREAVERAFAALRAGLEAALQEPGAQDERARVELLIRRFVRFVAERPEFVRLMNDEGKREGPRMRWIVENHVRPLFDATQAITASARSVFPAARSIDPLHLHYILVGAVTQLFHQAPECRRLTGRDPSDPAVREAHADALVALFLRGEGASTGEHDAPRREES